MRRRTGLRNTALTLKTKGRDGVYFTYTEEVPIAFNPFYVEEDVYKRQGSAWASDCQTR